MSQLVALSLSIGVLGGIATFVFLQFMPSYLIWAAFIAWACYFHTGGNTEALKKTIICNIFGAVCAWVAALLLTSRASRSGGGRRHRRRNGAGDVPRRARPGALDDSRERLWLRLGVRLPAWQPGRA